MCLSAMAAPKLQVKYNANWFRFNGKYSNKHHYTPHPGSPYHSAFGYGICGPRNCMVHTRCRSPDPEALAARTDAADLRGGNVRLWAGHGWRDLQIKHWRSAGHPGIYQ